MRDKMDNLIDRHFDILVTIIIFMALLWAWSGEAGTCTSTTRTNYVSNEILTSSDLNLDFNNILTSINAFDGGCVTSNTLEDDSLNTTSFVNLLNYYKDGCKITKESASAISIDKCVMGVNGNFVRTTAAVSAAFGCSGCSAEANTTTYYAYAKNDSDGATLNLLLLTTVPGADGYDASSNKVLGKFYNDGSGDIDEGSIQPWDGNSFRDTNNTTGFLGNVRWSTTASCAWARSSDTFGEMGDDADCDDTVRVCHGVLNTTNCAAGAGDGQQPKIELSSVPAGKIRISARGGFFGAGGADSCVWRIADQNSNATVAVVHNISGGGNSTPYFEGDLYYTSAQTATTFYVQNRYDDASSTCTIDAQAYGRGFELSVQHFPLDY